MKIIRRLVLSLLLAGFIAAPAHAFDACHPDDDKDKYVPIATRYKTGLMFKVSKCGVQPSYLLGTMHTDDPKVVTMLSDAFSKIAYAKSASFEIKQDDEENKNALSAMFIQRDSIETLQSIIGIDLYSRLRQLMAKIQPDVPENNYYRMRPWAVAVLLQEPPNKGDGVALDFRLQSFAKQRNIPIYQLESAQEQMDVFRDIPVPQQIGFLQDAVDNYDQIDKDNKEMDDIYLKQDLNALQVLADKSFDMIKDREFANQLRIALVDKRNRVMVSKMQDRIDEGGAFIAIGALHLTGKSGILKLLEDKGYFIDPVNDATSAAAEASRYPGYHAPEAEAKQ